MRALEIITGHVIYNLAYTYKFQLKTNQGEEVENAYIMHGWSLTLILEDREKIDPFL